MECSHREVNRKGMKDKGSPVKEDVEKKNKRRKC